MNEVTRIHLGRQQFIVAVDAHAALQKYLHAIERQVDNDEEVIREIELRIAELLVESGSGGDKVVLAEDVAHVREQLGEPAAFGDGNTTATRHESASKYVDATNQKRLFRDTDTAMLAGVSSGLATYFGVDVLIIRLIFVVLTLTGAAGIFIYIVLWLLVPEAKTNSERLQMRGQPVTVESLKNLVERADVEGAASRAAHAGAATLRKVIEILTRCALYIVGIGLIFIGIALFIGTMIAGVYALIHGAAINDQVVFPIGSKEVALLIMAMVSLVIVALSFNAVGFAALRQKWVVSKQFVVALVAVFLLAVTIGGALGLDAGPPIRERIESTDPSRTSEYASL